MNLEAPSEGPLVRFYQPDPNRFGPSVARLLTKAYEQGRRVLMLAENQSQAHEWDQYLWRYPENGFLPHAVWSASYPERQPLLIALEPTPVNKASILLHMGLTPLSEPERFQMVIHFVDKVTPERHQQSRELFRHYRDQVDCTLEHWTQTPEGGWTQNA